MRRILFAFALLPLFGLPAAAEPARAVVELFTSQGCSSCPPADAALADLATADDLVALSYHVDYWDYLGWRDTLASPENTRRQQLYARTFGTGSVYTPQAVLNGRRHVSGADRAAIDAGLADPPLPVAVSLVRDGDRVIAETAAGPTPAGEVVILFVWFRAAVDVTIERGENRGAALRYVNAVTAFTTAGMYHGGADRFEQPVSEAARAGADGCAVLVQEIGAGGAPGAILGAAQIRL